MIPDITFAAAVRALGQGTGWPGAAAPFAGLSGTGRASRRFSAGTGGTLRLDGWDAVSR
ncbi:hypothetical protein AB0M10_04140 [Streptomyces sp. NPDC051840]|uniref:hypothetical protein n=1 Tax=unclassified Streptomyces TaxID=2593676 RepID=UPI0034294199